MGINHHLATPTTADQVFGHVKMLTIQVDVNSVLHPLKFNGERFLKSLVPWFPNLDSFEIIVQKKDVQGIRLALAPRSQDLAFSVFVEQLPPM